MKIISPILTCLILAGVISAIAIIAVQNATPVSIKFFTFESIQLPVGVVLAFSVAVGLIFTSILIPIWQRVSLTGEEE
ncbi:LapA family protein [Capilliphycus salinus ALCB114379]|uniref:LapA family protein n=1 Tax=Capilliphycus salinus TaxID=2768948 RepID=UPI0039A4158B